MVLGSRANGVQNTSGSNGLAAATAAVTAAIDSSSLSADRPPQRPNATRSSSSFLSRLSLPLRSRAARNIVDFHIRPSEPHRKYTAGDVVTGAVVFTILKPLRITHLTVALHGLLRVYKTPGAGQDASGGDVGAGVAGRDSSTDTSEGTSTSFRFLGNGQASLFKDEQVLSAEGPLGLGRYEFGFELLFPGADLPSSIDFERGAISYVITSTLTRPLAIGATTHCERRVELIEKLDIGPLVPPRPRIIYLDPRPKKIKRRRQGTASSEHALSTNSERTIEAESNPDSAGATQNGSRNSTTSDAGGSEGQPPPRSPVQSDHRSEISTDSIISGSTGFSARMTDQSQSDVAGSRDGRAKSRSEKSITAKIEVLKGACLPGETIPVRISVQHIKRIRSLHGVIVTLYRQGRVDSNPPVATFNNLSKEEASRLERENYYPRSKTGLSGLSLSSAGSCSVFRKDLSQAFSPLMTDPLTFGANVTTNVRVPEYVFPTIKGVPGEMISFKYRVEVLVDLAGKLANAIQVGNDGRLGPNTGGSGAGGIPDRNVGGMSLNGTIINTDSLKREKGVIYDSFEIIVGTSDSRRKGKAPQGSTSQHDTYDNAPQVTDWNPAWDEPGFHPDDERQQQQQHQQQHQQQDWTRQPTPVQYPLWQGPGSGSAHEHESSAPSYVPMPEVPDERNMTDKERVRRAEQVLLPSAPSAPSGLGIAMTSAPPVEGPVPPDNIHDANENGTSTQPQNMPTVLVHAPTNSGHSISDTEPSAPTIEDLVAPVQAVNPHEDKQEMEHRRLLAEASAPPEFPPDQQDDISTGPSAPATAVTNTARVAPQDDRPSAPMLTEEDEYEHQIHAIPHNHHQQQQQQQQRRYHDDHDSLAGPSTRQGYESATAHEPLPRYER